ncbi:MAG: serine hydrolase [Oscillospiraceae bacterium]|nr:serine hydrolase [Oscillospiraceae bacterium]
MKKLTALLLAGMLALTACSSKTPSQPLQLENLSASAATALESAAAAEQSQPEPDNSWQFDMPENHGMDPAVFEQLHTALAGSTVYAMVTAKDGVIIDEYYQEGYDENSVFPLHSCSKSFTSALVGIALEQGYLSGVDAPLSDYLPQVLELEDSAKQQITLRHLLTHTSGLEWYEWAGRSNWAEFRSAENWVDYILGRSLVSQPGTTFAYSTGGTHLLAAALEAATGKKTLDYAQENLFAPLGMESVTWGTDPQGIADGGNGISMTLRDAARFGQLYLQGGMWNGRQLVPADWVADSTTVKNSGAGDGTGSYGYQWWIRSFAGYETFYAFGAHGQFILIVPELNLVTAIASNSLESSYIPRDYFIDYVLPAYVG